MPWYIWLVLASLVLNALVVVIRVGEPCKPTDGADAAGIVLYNGLVIWAIVAAVTS